MAHNQPHPDPFWDFIRSFDPNAASGAGVDHNAAAPEFLRGFPFFHPSRGHHGPGRRGPGRRGAHGPPGPHGPHGPHTHHGPPGHHGPPPPHGWHAGPFGWGVWAPEDGTWNQEAQRTENTNASAAEPEAAASQNEKSTANEKDGSPDTMMREDAPDPAEVTPDEADQANPPPYRTGRCGGRGGCGSRGRRGRHQQHEDGRQSFPFDLSALINGFSGHPFVQQLQEQMQAQTGANRASSSDDQAFSPPLDLFNTPSAYVLHLALPGANKSDIGVDWNPDSGVLKVAGVVHRPGDEEFLQTLVEGERRVGLFEREITLPPKGSDKDEIDAEAITAKMEDGVLIVTVPKVEKEWTEIRKVDIE